MGKYYQGKFVPINREKYVGDVSKIRYRSLWERQVFRWCDKNRAVRRWSSEELVIPYICATDGKAHRYFTDLMIEFENGDRYVVEIKPKSQTQPPKTKKSRSRKYLKECATWAKNSSKWEAAEAWCKKNGYTFTIWTEDTIKKLGIKLYTA